MSTDMQWLSTGEHALPPMSDRMQWNGYDNERTSEKVLIRRSDVRGIHGIGFAWYSERGRWHLPSSGGTYSIERDQVAFFAYITDPVTE